MNSSPGNPFNKNWTLNLLLVFVIGSGAFLRYTDLSAPLLDFHPTRQLFGAIKARGIYYESLPNAPAWQKDLAVRLYEVEATIEPPLMENITAAFYHYFGVQTAIPRAISATFWMFGGFFLYLISKQLSGSRLASTTALAFYLLTPYSVSASRAFQPDPLMVLLILSFWWGIINWGQKQTWKWAIFSGIAGGLAIFVKFTAAFFVCGAAVGVIFAWLGLNNSLKKLQTWVIILLGAVVPGWYLIYGTYMNGFLEKQFAGRFFPEMWVNPYFYLRWFLKLTDVTSVLWITLALLGWAVFSRGPVKVFLGSLWLTYFVYGMISTHHISSHDYYSLPVIAITALCLAQPVSNLNLEGNKDSGIERRRDKIHLAGSLQFIIVFILLASILLVSAEQYFNRRANDHREEAVFWAKVGDATGHQPGLLALTTDYGYPLAYYGWQKSNLWPASTDIKDFNKTFIELTTNKAYFLITDFDEYDRQPELRKQLDDNYPILIEGSGFMVYDLVHPKK